MFRLRRHIGLSIAIAAVGGLAAVAWAATELRVGEAAYGDFKSDAPGLLRKITPADLPKALATPSTANRSKVVPRPDGVALKTMPGFKVAEFATGLKGARVVRVAPNGDVFVAQSRPEGKITVLRAKDGASKPDVTETFAEKLNQPFGIAFYPPGPDPQWVYVAETTQVVRFPYKAGALKAAGSAQVVIGNLPTGGHWTRDIAFSPDGKTLYLSIGSASNVAEDLPAAPDLSAWEKTHALGATWGREEWRADVLAYDPDGGNRRVFAAGLRNCSGIAVQPGTGAVWCATNERDLLGDNLPPDYVTSVKEGAFYGWPWYYIGSNEDHRHAGKRPDLAGKVTVPDVLVQPHSAPLGLAFNTGAQFPADMKGDAFVALHGSWNRELRTGYKIVRLPFKDGKATGEYQDFVIGFALDRESVWGRPVAVAFAHDGAMLFSDDEGGIVWRVSAESK
jgi:glucose/arabinose dehydrogenase